MTEPILRGTPNSTPPTELTFNCRRVSDIRDTDVACTDGRSSFEGRVADNGAIIDFVKSPLGQWAAQCGRFKQGAFTIEESGFCILPATTAENLSHYIAAARADASSPVRLRQIQFDAAAVVEQKPALAGVTLAIAQQADVPPALIIATLYNQARMAITVSNLFAAATWRAETRRPEFVAAWQQLQGGTPIRSDDPVAKVLAIALRSRRTLDAIGMNKVQWSSDMTVLTVNQLAAFRWAYQRPADIGEATALAADPNDALGDAAAHEGIRRFADVAAAIHAQIAAYRLASGSLAQVNK